MINVFVGHKEAYEQTTKSFPLFTAHPMVEHMVLKTLFGFFFNFNKLL
jgi:hypothetical protein